MSIIFETKHLIAKSPSLKDFNNLYSLQSDAQVMQYIGTGERRTIEEVRESLQEIIHYYEKNGFSFFSIFEKNTGHFVGQGGFFHLGFDDTQPTIELGYRLHKIFWNKGYATELAKGLITWGFSNLGIDKLVAVIKPENDRSRKVLQKAGMSYIGKMLYKGIQVDNYEIHKNIFDYSAIKLIPASLNEYSIIQNMARFYVYDMSEYLGWGMPEDGLYECIDFKKYWQTDDAFPFLIRDDKELIGFVIIDKKGSEPSTDFNMAQFFILRKFTKKGLGRYIAHLCFDKFQGSWEVMVIPGNEGAYRFWRSIINEYTSQKFSEDTRQIPHLENNIKNIFKFNSRLSINVNVP